MVRQGASFETSSRRDPPCGGFFEGKIQPFSDTLDKTLASEKVKNAKVSVEEVFRCGDFIGLHCLENELEALK